MFPCRTTLLLLFVTVLYVASKPPVRKKFKLVLSRNINNNTEQHFEAEIRCRHEMLYPNNTLMKDVLRIMRINNITVKANDMKQGKIIPKRRNLHKGENMLPKMFKLILSRYIDNKTEQHLEAEIRCSHELLYPNNSFVSDVLRLLRINNITVKANNKKQGRILHKGENMIKDNDKKQDKILPKRRDLDNGENMDYENDAFKLSLESNQNNNSTVDVVFNVNVAPNVNIQQNQAGSESRSKTMLMGYETESDDSAEQGYVYDSRTGSCYKFQIDNFTWYQASKNCELEGGHLAVINDETEATTIMELFAQYPPDALLHLYWWDHVNIGFYDIVRKTYSQADFRTVINPNQTVQEAGYDRLAPHQLKQPWCPEYDYYCGAAGRDGVLSTVCCVWPMASICERKPQNVEDGIQC